MRLTATALKTLKLPEDVKDNVIWDDRLPGFGLRLRASGARSWIVQYAVAGKTRRLTIGTPAQLDPGKAFDAAKNKLAQVRLGGDPVAEKDGPAFVLARQWPRCCLSMSPTSAPNCGPTASTN
jgi:hypothetical protein